MDELPYVCMCVYIYIYMYIFPCHGPSSHAPSPLKQQQDYFCKKHRVWGRAWFKIPRAQLVRSIYGPLGLLATTTLVLHKNILPGMSESDSPTAPGGGDQA